MNNDGRIDSPASATRSPKRPSGGDDIVGLLQHLTSQGTHLAQEQVKLVQAEVREGIEDLKAAIGAMRGAAVVGVAGFGVLLMALYFLLGDAIDNLGLEIGRAAGGERVCKYVLISGVAGTLKRKKKRTMSN